MAEVYTHQKRGAGIWPWILAILIIGFVIWFASARNDRREEGPRASLMTEQLDDSGASIRNAA